MTPRTSARIHAVTLGSSQPPWFVRALGALILVVDLYFWLGEGAHFTVMEFAKHGVILLIGMRFFYPEAARWVANKGMFFYTHKRRTD